MIAKRVAVLLAAILAAGAIWAAAAGSSNSSGYEPVLSASNFVSVINNRYYPLPVARVWVYKGVKDGQTQIDTVRVLAQTKLVAEGIRARVVSDVATHGSKLLEKTFDWYAQDKQGNVWYLGEDTTAYLPNGKLDKSGSWEAGVGDAEPGLIMKAAPKLPDAYRQEYLAGQAEDTAWIVGGSELAHRALRHCPSRPHLARGDPNRAGALRQEGLRPRNRDRARTRSHRAYRDRATRLYEGLISGQVCVVLRHEKRALEAQCAGVIPQTQCHLR